MTRLSIWPALALTAAVATILSLNWQPAHAHSWYDYDCCSDEDCRPAKPGEIRVTDQLRLACDF